MSTIVKFLIFKENIDYIKALCYSDLEFTIPNNTCRIIEIHPVSECGKYRKVELEVYMLDFFCAALFLQGKRIGMELPPQNL